MKSLRPLFALLALSLLKAPISMADGAIVDPGDPLPVRGGQPEHIPGVTTFYDSVEVEPGTRLRILITRPDGVSEPMEPLFFTQWVSCRSLAYRPDGGDFESFAHLARHSGLSLVRVERSGSGDSTGVPCSELDYDTEIAHYRKAFQHVLDSGRVDDERLFFLGISLGSTTAPLVARHFQEQGHALGGIAVQGGGAYSYLERMLAFEQHYLDRRPGETPSGRRTEAFQQRARFLVEYLVAGRHPDEIAKDSDAMATVRGDILGMDATHHYGRPYAWHQQAARRDFVDAWASLAAPVLVLYNEFDQYESLYGAQLLADTVNRAGAGSATLIVEQGLDHNSVRHDSAIDAYAGEEGTDGWALTAGEVATWLRAIPASGRI